MARQSPLRTVTSAETDQVLEEHPELEQFLMNLYHCGVLDGRHDQAMGGSTPPPFDRPLC